MTDANGVTGGGAGLRSRATGHSAAGSPEGSGLRWLPLAAAMIVLDQLVKLWVVANFRPYETHRVLPVLDFSLLYNTGAAWSFLANASGWQRWMFTALAALVSGGIVLWLRGLRSRSQALLACSLALILGGALGNMIDRIRMGQVIDFILAHWNEHWFPAFNVADSCISVGAALLLLDALRESRIAKGPRT